MPPKIQIAKTMSTNVQIAIPSLLQNQFTIHKGNTITNSSMMPLSMLIIESARRYLENPVYFGKTSQTIDSALKPAFATIYSAKKNKEAALVGFAPYEKLADQFSTTVSGQQLRKYCATVPSKTSLKSVLEELSQSDELKIKEWYILPEEGKFCSECKRRVIVSLDGIECLNPEEQQTPKGREVCFDIPFVGHKCVYIQNPLFEAIGSGDEIYYTTFGAIFSQKGYLDRTSYVSPVTEHVGTAAGHINKIEIPTNIKYPVYYDLNKNILPTMSLPQFNVTYVITLFEREYSDAQRREALVKAALEATDAISSLQKLDLLMAGVHLAQFLYNLGIALDEDDILGSRTFGFNDICDMPLGTKDASVTFNDTHWLNEYKYVVSSHFELQNL